MSEEKRELDFEKSRIASEKLKLAVAALSQTTRQHFNKVAQLKMKYGKRYYSVALLLYYIMLGFDLIVLALIIFHLQDIFC